LPRAAREVEQRFSQSRRIDSETAEALLQRIRVEDPASLSATVLRHAIEPAWQRWQRDDEHADWLRGLTRAALALNRRSADRRLVGTWIQLFPQGPLAGELASAAREAAERHNWPYQRAGRKFHLWDSEKGPATLGRAMLEAAALEAAATADVLREAAIGHSQVGAGLVQAALARASDIVAEADEAGATAVCKALLDLIEQLGATAILSETRPWMVRGLLRPWRDGAPPRELKARIQRHLVATGCDPRIDTTPWEGIENAWRRGGRHEDAETLRLILKRWLVDASFETFFRIMGRTTDNPVQWRARERFWRRYHEGGHVQEAWFILGHEAERQMRAYRDELAEAGGYGQVDEGATPSHSALLMQIGDVVIADWTHNGSCCFWQRNAVRRPVLYGQRYDGNYMRNSKRMRRAADQQARELGSGPLWEALTHHEGWEMRFAEAIRRLTGIRV
jgi:hypothetical protein